VRFFIIRIIVNEGCSSTRALVVAEFRLSESLPTLGPCIFMWLNLPLSRSPSIWSKELHSPEFHRGDRVEWNKAWKWVLSHNDPSAPIKYLEACIKLLSHNSTSRSGAQFLAAKTLHSPAGSLCD
jgi:hypothetical protein